MRAVTDPRIRALCDVLASEVREGAGRHEYDGVVVDLSPDGVAGHLARIADAAASTPAAQDPYDEALLAATEARVRAELGVVGEHRRNPLWHVANLDLAVYDREYAPADDRAESRRRHLAAWPDAVGAAIEALDRVPAPVAEALLGAVRGLAADVDDAAALAAHAELVRHVEACAATGDPDAALGDDHLALLMGAGEAEELDLGVLEERADTERDRLRALLDEACARLRPGTAPEALLPELLADHPTDDAGIHAEARQQIEEATAFCLERDLLPELGGECLVGPAPPSRRWAMAMMSWAGPFEEDAASWYHVTPPDPAWPREEQEAWLAVFSRTTLPAITVHEVTPGHYAHGRLLRRVEGEARRTFLSYGFVEGWAHYAEELYVEEGFRAHDPRYAIGVCIEALIRVTRLAVALGVHRGTMTIDDAVRRFEEDAFLQGSAARAEAERATYDPTYGRYTLGKLAIRDLRDRARQAWGSSFTLRRFHLSMLELGAPPLGLLDHALAGPDPQGAANSSA